MTSDLEQIAEEIGEAAMVATDHELAVKLHESSQGIRAWIAANKESDVSIRRILWLEHGHMRGLYGDDGEMQCATCVVDFKRDPMARLIDAWNASRKERQVSEAREARPQRKEFVGAALAHAKASAYRPCGVLSIDRGPAGESLRAADAFDAAYRAMIEAEKVEAERGEGT